MNAFRYFGVCATTALAVFGLKIGWDSPIVAADERTKNGENVEVLIRGPVHEAFAQTVIFNPEPGIIVPKAPPGVIEELPPAQRPDGDHVAWVPGYWAWDDDRSDYLWVSGIWRAVPPGRQWVPGNWNSTGSGFQWTSGYWADAKLAESEYLTEPPASVEAGPNTEPPSANDIWVPGSWMWNQSRYAWTPGYWAPAQQNWMWVPAQYLWSPRGYVYVGGYYDYSLARRGVLFAPVQFNSNVSGQRGFQFTPTMAINLAVFGNQLFLRPSYNHYYFGDYYGSQYTTAGYQPWFSFNSGGVGYDPFYAHQFWQNRQNPEWAKSVRTDFQDRADHEGSRPPRTLEAQQALVKSGDKPAANHLIAATSLDDLAKSKENPLSLHAVTKEQQQAFAKQGQAVHQFRESRQKEEADSVKSPVDKSAKPVDKSAKKDEPAKVKLPQSPIVAKSSGELHKDHSPPKPPVIPASDPKIEPKPRQALTKPAVPTVPPSAKVVEQKVAPKVVPKAETEPKPTPKDKPKK